jgi:hypothetical protein
VCWNRLFCLSLCFYKRTNLFVFSPIRGKWTIEMRWGPVRWINLCWHFCLMKLVCSGFIIKHFYLIEHLKIRLYWEALWTISEVKASQQFWMNFERVNPSFGHSHFRSIYTVTETTSTRIGVCQWFCNFCISLTWNTLLDQTVQTHFKMFITTNWFHVFPTLNIFI